MKIPLPRIKRQHRVIPGFGLAMGITLLWLGLIVIIPLALLVIKPWEIGWQQSFAAIMTPRSLAAFKVSFGLAMLAAVINVFLGLLLAWVLVRIDMPGKKIIDACVDLPFALPTAVAGIALTALLVPQGWVGQFLTPLGIKIAYSQSGILVAMVFIGLPFVVRSLQPVLEELGRMEEEVAASLGATASQTFWRVSLPTIFPAIITGFGLAFARGLSEYGSIIFIAGNIPGRTEIVPLLIAVKLQQFDMAGAAAIGVAMLLLSFVILYAINQLNRNWWRSAARESKSGVSESHDLTSFLLVGSGDGQHSPAESAPQSSDTMATPAYQQRLAERQREMTSDSPTPRKVPRFLRQKEPRP